MPHDLSQEQCSCATGTVPVGPNLDAHGEHQGLLPTTNRKVRPIVVQNILYYIIVYDMHGASACLHPIALCGLTSYTMPCIYVCMIVRATKDDTYHLVRPLLAFVPPLLLVMATMPMTCFAIIVTLTQLQDLKGSTKYVKFGFQTVILPEWIQDKIEQLILPLPECRRSTRDLVEPPLLASRARKACTPVTVLRCTT